MTGIGHRSRSTDIFSHFPQLLPLFHETHLFSGTWPIPPRRSSKVLGFLEVGPICTVAESLSQKYLFCEWRSAMMPELADLRRGYSDPCVALFIAHLVYPVGWAGLSSS